MAWIESHQDLEDHPKLVLLCQKTGWGTSEAIGVLHRFWWWALKYSEDGDLSKYDPVQYLGKFDCKESVPALLEIFITCGFIDKDLLIHNWWDYSGRYLTGKYRTQYPEKLTAIKNKYDLNRIKIGLKSAHLPTLTNLPTYQPTNYADWIESIKKNSAYKGINIDRELGRMDAWLSTRPKRKKTKRFILNWLNRIDVDVRGEAKKEGEGKFGKVKITHA